VKIPYNDLEALEKELSHPHVAGFLVEPIQAEAGVYVPEDNYLKNAAQLCKKYNVLLAADEVQTGLCRTGKMLACDHEDVRPDLLILGKAASGGMYPVSCVLADDEIMLTIKPGEHGSTYGGNPLAAKVSLAAMNVLQEEKLSENATKMGNIFREKMTAFDSPLIEQVRGKGLLNAIQINPVNGKQAWDLCLLMKENGILAKPTHEHTIRFTPPLIITEAQIIEAIALIQKSMREFI